MELRAAARHTLRRPSARARPMNATARLVVQWMLAASCAWPAVVASQDASTSTSSQVTVIGVGDMMLGSLYPATPSYLAPNDGRDLLLPVRDVLRDATVTFGNLEGSLFSGIGTMKRCQTPSLCYLFKSPERYTAHFLDAGFDVLSIANNHVGDFGEEGRRSTSRALTDAGIAHAGVLSKPFDRFVRDGIRFGFMAIAPNSGTVSMRDIPGAQAIVRRLRAESDIVIVSFHGGGEGPGFRHVTRRDEIFHGENRGNPHAVARALIDAGADIVFGHGPHVTRAIDLYKDRFIAYSLGNFATYGRFNLKGSAGLAPIIKVTTDRTGRFIEARIVPTMQVGRGGPLLDPRAQVLREIRELTEADVPESGLLVQDDGRVVRRPR